MCGIVGFNWPDLEKIKAMADEMRKRGPNDHGYYVDNNISLGHRRLSILDLSSAGHQPMFDSKNEMVIIYNGEIYNFQIIRQKLIRKGYKFNSKSDTEVILYAYKEWGPKCVKMFNGIFAFAIYEINKKKIFLARDHIGIKPLYYYKNKNKFIFSSTIPSILLHDIHRTPNKRLIRDFLLYSITDHTEETFFKEVAKFPKGHYAIYDLRTNKLKLYKWWENKFIGDYEGNYKKAVKEFKKLIIESVNNQLISDVPVGVCLSGGIDSSTIASLIKKSKRTKMKTFSAIFPGFSKDESKYIDLISSKTKMENYYVIPEAETLKKELFQIIIDLGEPVPNASLFTQFKVFELCKKNNVTVLLNGEGSDELFAGYHYFYGFYLKGLFKKGKIGKAIKEIICLIKGRQYKIGLLSLGFLLVPLFIRKYHFQRQSNISKSLLKNKKYITPFFKEYYKINNLQNALEFHLEFKLEHLLKWEDRPSMAYSREARVPFLDVNILKFVFRLPEEYIISQGKTKAILRDAMEGIVPDEILDRRDKVGYDSPEDKWLREKPIKEILGKWFINNIPKCRKYIDLEKTRKMIVDHLKEKNNYGKPLWRSIFLEGWLRIYFKN